MTSPAAIPQEKKRDNFIMLPNMTDDDLNIYEFRLLGHYTRVCGQEGGRCWQGIITISEKTGMSLGMVTKTRNSLEAKGFINVSVPDGKSRNRGAALCVSLVDRWEENTKRYSKEDGALSQDETGISIELNQLMSHSEIAVSPHETNKININKDLEVQEENTTTALVPVANPEQDKPATEKTGDDGVYVIPALTVVDLWEFNARTLPAEIEPPASYFVLEETTPKHEPAAQLQPVQSEVSSTPPPVPPHPLPEPDQDTGLADVVKAYEANIGLIVPMIADAIKGALQDYPAAWITDAIEIAVEQNVRKWSYVVGILERWRVRGKQATPVKFMAAAPDKPADDFDPFNRDVPPQEAAPIAELVDPDWQALGMLVKTQALSAELYSTFKQCKFGGVKDGLLTVICPTDPVFKACYRTLRHNRWLFWQAESLWGGITDVEFVLEGDTDAVPEVP